MFWLKNDELFLIHSPREPSPDQDSLFHFVGTNKAFNHFAFRKSPFPLLFPYLEGDAPARKPPPRFSVQRLRKWDAVLEDMLIVSATDSADVAILTNTSEKISPDQEAVHEFQITGLEDNRKAQVPRLSLSGEGESVLIGEGLDLSSNEKVQQPAPRLEEINESPHPLPAYFLLTHEGVLAAWWVVWDKSLENGKAYPGLTVVGQEGNFGTPIKPATPDSKSAFGQSTTSISSTPLGKPTTPFSATPLTPAFGTTGLPSATPAFGKPTQPAFGATSAMGAAAAPAFGTTGMGNKQSPWGSQPTASQTPTNPFAAAAGNQSGFAKFGSASPGASTFSSFSSNKDGQSGFGALGQQKSVFGSASNPFSTMKTEPSFGSTVTVDSKLSGPGSTLPSWANTPAQTGSSIFGQQGSSFPTSSFGSTNDSGMSDGGDAQSRGRDEVTPTPQVLPQQSKGLFGLPSGGFKLDSTFKADSSAKDESDQHEEPSGKSLFGSGFSTALGNTAPKSPATPVKTDQNKGISTTPATLPKPTSNLFSVATPKVPPRIEEPTIPEDAPLPPDPMTWKPKKTDDDLPPLAGSPPVKVEVPGSSVTSSPLTDEEDEGEEEGDEDEDDGDDENEHDEGGDISVEEEQSGEEEVEEPSPSDTARKARQPVSGGWTLSNSVSQSPRIFPAAPTPPQTGRNGSPALSAAFSGQAFKPAPSPFSQGFKSGVSPLAQHPASASPAAHQGPSKSTAPFSSLMGKQHQSYSSNSSLEGSISGTKREPLATAGASLSASMQQHSKPPTPQPQVSDLIDDEDERVRRELESDIEPSRKLDPFLARQEYGGVSQGKTGHAAQIEIVYRDINNMVDTLGLNWRSLKAFLEYHERPERYAELKRSDLEEVSDQEESWFEKWCLVEIADLRKLEVQLEQELDAGRVQNVVEKLSILARLSRDLTKLDKKIEDMKYQIRSRKDPEKIEAIRKASLPRELVEQQKALRSKYAQLLTLLGKAEEDLMLLRSKLVSYNAEKGRTGAIPTFDAVKKTILKLTAMAEKKNNDITSLEAQLRKVGLNDSNRPSSGSSRRPATPSRRSRAMRSESPFATPPTSRTKMSLSELKRKAMTPEAQNTPTNGYGFFYTPEGSPTPARTMERLGNMVNESLPALRETAKRRRDIAEKLATVLIERGVRTTKASQS